MCLFPLLLVSFFKASICSGEIYLIKYFVNPIWIIYITFLNNIFRVLSDPQERAWYDKHRAQILQGNGRGTQMGETSDYQESRVDVFQYFTRSCFEKFDDDVKV